MKPSQNPFSRHAWIQWSRSKILNLSDVPDGRPSAPQKKRRSGTNKSTVMYIELVALVIGCVGVYVAYRWLLYIFTHY